MEILKKLLLLTMALLLSGPAYCQTFEQSVEAYDGKDYKTAFDGFKKWAEQGNANAQFYMAMMYANGTGVPKNEQQVVFWYCMAAEQGNASAQYNLGLLYAYGIGVPEDVRLAYFWWLLSSTQGKPSSVKNRDIVEKRLTLQQRANAQAAAQTWTPKLNGRPTSCAKPVPSAQ